MPLKLIQGKQLNVNLTGSFTGSFSGSFDGTGSYAINALTASYLSGYVSPFPYTGSALITGSLGITGSLDVSGSVQITENFIQGLGNTVTGFHSHAQGSGSVARATGSHAEGGGTIASASFSHAEGRETIASASYSHAEGYQTISTGFNSHAEGRFTTSSGNSSHAEGSLTVASGFASHAEGFNTIAQGEYSHAEGRFTTSSGDYSHAEGLGTVASGSYQHVQGRFNISSSAQSAFIIGNGTANGSRSNLVFASGSTFQITGSLDVSGIITGSLFGTSSFATTASFAISSSRATSSSFATSASFVVSSSFATSASFATSTSFTINALTASNITPAIVASSNNRVLTDNGDGTITGEQNLTFDGTLRVTGQLSQGDGSAEARGDYSHAEGNLTTTLGDYSHAEGNLATASGDYSHAEGDNTQAKGNYSHAEGQEAISSGSYSHAEGYDTEALGQWSHAEGRSTTATGDWSHAEGRATNALGPASHAEGSTTQATAEYSHAEGELTLASEYASHAEGYYTVASGRYQHVQGQFNISSSAQSAFIIGNGTAVDARSNLIFASGSQFQVTGSVIATQGFTGSLFGTASYASQALSASFAVSSSRAVSSSFATQALSASFALTASLAPDYQLISGTGSMLAPYVLSSNTSSFIQNNQTSSMLAPYVQTSSTSSMTVLSASNATTASYVVSAVSSSFSSTASFAPLYLPLTGGTVNGNININGTASIAFLNVTYESASVIYSSGSNVFGDATNDTQTLIGTVIVSGSQRITGSLRVTQGITGSLLGTASKADQVFINDNLSNTIYFPSIGTPTTGYQPLTIQASLYYNVDSDTFVSPNFSGNLTGDITGNVQGTASYATQALSASFAVSSSRAVSSSFSSTASFAPLYLPLTGGTIDGNVTVNGTASIAFLNVTYESASVIYSSGSNVFGDATNDVQTLIGTVIVSGSQQITGSLNVTAGITGSLFGTASYASNGGVTQLLAGPNISLSPTTGVGQVTISSTGGGGFNTATGSYGSFYSTVTQTNVASTARSMSLDTTDITNGVSVSGSTNPFNTYIKTENAGVYDIQFSAQVDKSDAGADEIWIWLRKNGTNLTDTATSIKLTGNADHQVAAWNFFVNAAANDYFQLMWYSPDANVRLHAEPAFGVVPGIPSVIVTVNRVDQFLSNTGSFSGSFTGQFTGSLFGTSSYATQALSASYAPSIPTFPFTGSAIITGSLVVTGSLRGNIISSSITSTTASLDLATSNFFTLTLDNGANTHISASNIQPGQTVNIRVTQGSAGTGTVSFNSAIKQSSGSLYTGSMIANAVDVVSLIAFDSTNAYISYINNFV